MASKTIPRWGANVVRSSLRPASHNAPRMFSARRQFQPVSIRTFRCSTPLKGIIPDAEEPPRRQAEDSERPTVPTDISTSEYNKRADEFMDDLVSQLEAEQDARTDIEVEYSAGVMEISLQSQGTYVLNKQPPNKQIWLSSPLSGPKRFDWVVTGEGLHQKGGGAVGDWIYLRDGTSLTNLIRKELGVTVGVDKEAPQ